MAERGGIDRGPAKFVGDYVKELLSRSKRAAADDPKVAAVYSCLAEELASRAQAFYRTELSIGAAAAESGYTPDSLRRLKADGLWTGTRIDLPRRPAEKAPTKRAAGGAR